MVYKIMNKNETNKESENSRVANDKGGTSTDLLGDMLKIENKVTKHGKCIRDDSTMCCWQYGLVQVCKIKDEEIFVLFGMSLNVSLKNKKVVFHAGDKKGLKAMISYLSLLNLHPEP